MAAGWCHSFPVMALLEAELCGSAALHFIKPSPGSEHARHGTLITCTRVAGPVTWDTVCSHSLYHLHTYIKENSTSLWCYGCLTHSSGHRYTSLRCTPSNQTDHQLANEPYIQHQLLIHFQYTHSNNTRHEPGGISELPYHDQQCTTIRKGGVIKVKLGRSYRDHSSLGWWRKTCQGISCYVGQ